MRERDEFPVACSLRLSSLRSGHGGHGTGFHILTPFHGLLAEMAFSIWTTPPPEASGSLNWLCDEAPGDLAGA